MPSNATSWQKALLHNFIQRNLNSGSAQVQILFAPCRMVPVMVMVPVGKKTKHLSSASNTTKTIHHHHHYHHHHHHQKIDIAGIEAFFSKLDINLLTSKEEYFAFNKHIISCSVGYVTEVVLDVTQSIPGDRHVGDLSSCR